MKLLKLALIAIVTVGIYSFTSIENDKETPIKNKTEYYDGCITIYFKPNITKEQKNLGWDWVRRQPEFNLGTLLEKGIDYEKWSYIGNGVTRDIQGGWQEDDENGDIIYTIHKGKDYIVVTFGCDNSNTFTKI